MKKTVLTNGKLLNPIKNTCERTNILMINNIIKGLGYLPDENEKDCTVIDIANHLVVPHIIDSYTHLRTPGQETMETYASASKAAKNGGITTLFQIPSTTPCLDQPELIRAMSHLAKAESKTSIHLMGTLTKEKKGKQLAEYGLMRAEGAVGFTDNNFIQNPIVFRNILKYSQMLNTPIVVRPIDPNLSEDGEMHEGYYSTILGLRGMPSAAEAMCVSRDIELVREYGGKVHFFPITTKESVNLIRKAKKEGLAITCGTAPHYFMLTHQAVEGYDTNTKVNPPLRPKEDMNALITGLKDGTIDVIASDHRPTLIENKRTDYKTAEFGISGLDLFIPLILTKLYHEEKIELQTIFEKVTINPAKIFGINYQNAILENKAKLTIIDLNSEKEAKKTDLFSLGKNTPFSNYQLKGVIHSVI